MTTRKIFAALAFGCLAALASSAPATTQPATLDAGLAYVRVHSLAADGKALETACAAGGALVVDLRYPAVRAGDEDVLAQDLASRHGTQPLYILVSPSTPASLATAIARAAGPEATLGVADSVPKPKVVVFQTSEADRTAYDAADAGKELGQLILGKIQKDRYDEASLVNDFNNGNPNPEPPAAPDPRDAKGNAKAPALVDRVLQRAVNLNRALAAIKPRS
ncbi:MAG TPA: hypothetical protein VGM73_00315 [Candidatus Didemnitutus sp.]|jgi:hypothetical protein